MDLELKLEEKKQRFREEIIGWYERHGRKDLPWRKTVDPWRVLIAAFLLRKTTLKQVLRIYSIFLTRYSDPHSLIHSPESEIEELIRPLGIEKHRTKQLKRMAELIVEEFNGKIPSSKEALKRLPGVGEYIASEVILCAFKRPEPLLDRNMIRIIERVFAIHSLKRRPHTDPKLWAFARSLVPEEPNKAKKFNYGILDFARIVCTVKNPKCSICEINSICKYFMENGDC